MARPARISQSEHPYHVSTRTNNKEYRFHQKKVQKALIASLAEVLMRASKIYEVQILHLVLMATHYHMIINTPLENISLFMQYVNARIAELFNKAQNRTGHLWGERFYSTIIDTAEYMKKVIRYIYGNPKKAGIVENPLDYENSTICFYAFGRQAFVQVTEDGFFISLGDTPEERRQTFIREIIGIPMTSEEMEETRKGLRKRFYGGDEFTKTMQKKHVQPLKSKSG